MNLAARLCSAAKAEQILVSEATYRKIGDRVAAVAMPPMRFKNKAQEQKVFNVIGLRGTHPWRHETARHAVAACPSKRGFQFSSGSLYVHLPLGLLDGVAIAERRKGTRMRTVIGHGPGGAAVLLLAVASGLALAQPAQPAEAATPSLADLAAKVALVEAYINNADPKAGYTPGPGHNGFMMIAAALVLFMTLPGLALFYGGLVRRKNVLSVLAQCLGCAGLVTHPVVAGRVQPGLHPGLAGPGRLLAWPSCGGWARPPTPTSPTGSRRACSACTS